MLQEPFSLHLDCARSHLACVVSAPVGLCCASRLQVRADESLLLGSELLSCHFIVPRARVQLRSSICKLGLVRLKVRFDVIRFETPPRLAFNAFCAELRRAICSGFTAVVAS